MTNTPNYSPPPMIICSSDPKLEIDEHSEVTWNWREDELKQDMRSFPEIIWPSGDDELSEDDKFDEKLAADPYYIMLDGRHPPETSKQELLELKLQIARQQEKIDIISSKLSECQVENETLKAEKTVLINELALKSNHKHQSKPPKSWFSKGVAEGGSMKLLLDTNAKLILENERLNVVAGITRKSFQSFVKDSRRNSQNDRNTITKLLQEIEASQQFPRVPSKSTLSKVTAKTCCSSFDATQVSQEDFIQDSSSRYSSQDVIIVNSVPMTRKKSTKSSDPDIYFAAQGKLGDSTRNRTALNRSCTVSNDSMYKSPSEVARRDESKEMLVDFGETQRPNKSVRKWISF